MKNFIVHLIRNGIEYSIDKNPTEEKIKKIKLEIMKKQFDML